MLNEVKLLKEIQKLIKTDTIYIVPELIEKMEQLQKELPFWITELKDVIELNKTK